VDKESQFAINYDFQQVGYREIEVFAFDREQRLVASITHTVLVIQPSFVALIGDKSCDNPCTFKTDTSEDIYSVTYHVDGWEIGFSENYYTYFSIDYDFQNIGERNLIIRGYGKEGEEKATEEILLNVEEDPNRKAYVEVPYFYQYSNTQFPSSSCQNTSLAMVLRHYGWSGYPDDITSLWGKNHAQSPQGLAEVFNYTAEQSGIPKRITPITNGTISDLKAELDSGIPSIVHGYFTEYGHVVVVLGYDETGYWVNDPAGEWSETFQGGYPYGWNSIVGSAIYYDKISFEKAIATWDGYTPAQLWFHKIR
jgi:uncharacterized protein YvpB